ncbi:izumo sperm-egg fusion protein 4 isoform X6 [Odocoileus virginianus]|uniref:Izumo sperm-egg fusion protein 4 isoform X6 n=1 Tax=Odocoileus virginianus TaxID=9874 RepID=A0ABM4HZY4_ODOVR
MRLARSGGGTNKGVELPLGVAAPGRGVKEVPEPSVARYRGEAYAAGGAGSCSSREGAVGWCAAEACGTGAPLVGARRSRERRGRRRRLVGGGRGRAMALLLCLGLTAALARGCLHCHGNFSDKFSFYRHHVNLKSWWVGDIPVSGSLLSDWSQDTMKELHLAIPAEITREKLNQVAAAVYQRMDQLYQGKMYFPGEGPIAAGWKLRVFPQRAASYLPGASSSHPECHHRKPHRLSASLWSSAQWETAVQGLLQYIMDTNTSLISPSFTCLEPPHLANLTLENASECLMQH